MSHDAEVAAVQAWIEEHHDDLLRDTRAMLQIPSLEEDALPNAPFGQANRDALDLMLKWADESGMATTDLEGYCGFAEFGSGSAMVMSLGHLDVVPVGPGWKHEPFGAEIDGGYIYARGANDDKGPTMAFFYAARAVQAVLGDPGVRVRSVFGCNEESGFKCVERYMQTEESPTIGVAPDAGWPCIHGEKGIADFVIERPMPHGAITLLSMEGGQRPNIVIDSCRAICAIDPAYRATMEGFIADSWDRNLSFSWEGDHLTIEAVGKAAHGSYPFGGDNAAIRIFRFLKEAAPLEQEHDLDSLHEVTHIGGNGIGIAGSDEASGALSCNLGIVRTTADDRLQLTLNVRYPVTWDGDELKAKVEAKLLTLPDRYWLEHFRDSKPLYFPLDHPLVKTICEVHHAETGETKAPGTMGGGTYARAVPNCVAIGTGWAGDGPAHETDERLKVEHLFKMAKIYSHLLVKMCRVAKTMV